MAQWKMSILVLVTDHWRFYSRTMSTKAGRFRLATMAFSIVVILPAATAAAGEQSAAPSGSRIALSRTRPPMDGREVRVKIVEVTYAPGGANTAHTHPCPVIG